MHHEKHQNSLTTIDNIISHLKKSHAIQSAHIDNYQYISTFSHSTQHFSISPIKKYNVTACSQSLSKPIKNNQYFKDKKNQVNATIQ